MAVFYSLREEQDNKKLAQARDLLFEDKYKFYEIPFRKPLGDNKPDTRWRARRTANRFAPEPNYLHTQRGWSASKTLAWCRRRAARLGKYLEVIELSAARERRKSIASKLQPLDAKKLTDYTQHLNAQGLNQWLDDNSKRLEDARDLAGSLPPGHARVFMRNFWKLNATDFQNLYDALKPVASGHLPVGSTFSLRRDESKRLADHIKHAYATIDGDDIHGFSEGMRETARQEIAALPRGRGWTEVGTQVRFTDEGYWFTKLGREQNINDIKAARILQMLGHGLGRDFYLPQSVVQRIKDQQQQMQDWLAQEIITNGKSQKTLYSVAKNAPLNNYNRLVIQNVARANINRRAGMKAYFWTITVPSRFHSTSTKKGRGGRWYSVPNPKFDPTLNDFGSDWFDVRWVRFRGRLSKRLSFGPGRGFDSITVNEGHADATCHYHLIVWFPEQYEEFITQTLHKIFVLKDFEEGAEQHRIKIEQPESENGVLSYISKTFLYITKNVLNAESDKDRKEAAAAAYCAAIGKRRTRSSNMRTTVWEWLRRRGTYATMATTPETKRVLETVLGDPETHTTKPEHYEAFFESGVGDKAQGWLKSYTTAQLYDIEYRTLEDYLDENGGDFEKGLEAYDFAWDEYYNAVEHDRASPEIEAGVYKKKVQRLNKDGTQFYPNRPDSLIRLLPREGWEEIKVNEDPWKRDDDLSDAIQDAVQAEADEGKTTLLEQLKSKGIQAFKGYERIKKEPRLHLAILGQGGACGPTEPPENRMKSNDPARHEVTKPVQLSAAEHLAIRERVMRASELFLNG